MKKILFSFLIILLFITFTSLSGQNMKRIYELNSIISINDFLISEDNYTPIELKVFPGDGYLLYSFFSSENFSDQILKIEKFNDDKLLEGKIEIPFPYIFPPKLNNLSYFADSYSEFFVQLQNIFLFYNFLDGNIEEYKEENLKQINKYPVKLLYPPFDVFNYDEKIKLLNLIKNQIKEKSNFPVDHAFVWAKNIMFVDKQSNLFLFKTRILNFDKGYEDYSYGEDEWSFFTKLKKSGDKYIEDTDFMLKFDGTQSWYPNDLIQKNKNTRLSHESAPVGGQNISIYTAPYLDSFYFFNPYIFVQTTLDAQEIKEKVLTKSDHQKINDLCKKYGYERDKKFQFKILYMHTLYVDQDENVYVTSLKDIVIYDKNFNPVDMICPGNLKELGEDVFIDEIVKIEGNKMWLSVRRYTGEIFTSQEQDTREIWVIDIK